MRVLFAAVVALMLLAGAAPAWAQLSDYVPPPETGPLPDMQYPGQREGINCPDYPSQAAAQAMLRADPSDPAELDTDRNGIACERNLPPNDTAPVRR